MNKTTEALKLAEALENDAKEHREVSYGLDCPPECTANWKHALNCEAAARLIREALAEQSKCACDSPAWCTKYKKCNREVLGLPKAQPVKQEPVVVGYLDVGEGGYLDIGTDLTDDQIRERLSVGKHNLYTAPVDAKAIRAEALEEAEEIAKTIGGSFSVEFLAAIRGLK